MHAEPLRESPQVVFYVEDQPVNVTLMQALLERRANVQLVVAADVKQACEMSEHLRPALLLLDQRLPDGLGTDLLHTLRQRPAFADVPAVLVTAECDLDPRNSGFLELWPKPLDLCMGLDRVDTLLGPPRAAARCPTRWPSVA